MPSRARRGAASSSGVVISAARSHAAICAGNSFTNKNVLAFVRSVAPEKGGWRAKRRSCWLLLILFKEMEARLLRGVFRLVRRRKG
ncbi:hypothetical protein CW354_02865 [Marinicaulis flavus]|uniref:Uncharacterized protein n=1 Tax=Hyphococcus luteus TaxID=2058213 RepID=A0A2S7K8V8_9PROT|nr:hypothetical protein CW354_02865 [Marinicaulis flavus]